MANWRASFIAPDGQSNHHPTALCEPGHPRADVHSTDRHPNTGSLHCRAHWPTVRVQVPV